MAQKNEEKRTDIQKAAFALFSQREYKNVYIKDIAGQVGLTKSQIQNLYPRKARIIMDLNRDILLSCYAYVESKLPGEADLHHKLALNTFFYWEVMDSEKGLRIFINNIISDSDLRNELLKDVLQWHRDMKYSGESLSRSIELEPALIFSITGGLELYIRKERLRLNLRDIMKDLTYTFMRMMGCEKGYIEEVIADSAAWLKYLDIQEFREICKSRIPWLA